MKHGSVWHAVVHAETGCAGGSFAAFRSSAAAVERDRRVDMVWHGTCLLRLAFE